MAKKLEEYRRHPEAEGWLSLWALVSTSDQATFDQSAGVVASSALAMPILDDRVISKLCQIGFDPTTSADLRAAALGVVFQYIEDDREQVYMTVSRELPSMISDKLPEDAKLAMIAILGATVSKSFPDNFDLDPIRQLLKSDSVRVKGGAAILLLFMEDCSGVDFLNAELRLSWNCKEHRASVHKWRDGKTSDLSWLFESYARFVSLKSG